MHGLRVLGAFILFVAVVAVLTIPFSPATGGATYAAAETGTGVESGPAIGSPDKMALHEADSDCLSCHGGMQRELPTALAVRTEDCEACHDHAFLRMKISDRVHVVADPALVGTKCGDCHAVDESGAVKLVAEGDNLCLSCHKAVRNEFRLLSKHPYAEAMVTCMGCHPPHKKRVIELTYDQVAVYGYSPMNWSEPFRSNGDCLACHQYYVITDMRQSGFVVANTENLHAVHVERGFASCIECHEPHGSYSPKLIRDRLPDGTPLSFVYGDGWGTCSTTCHTYPHIQTKYGSDPRALSEP